MVKRTIFARDAPPSSSGAQEERKQEDHEKQIEMEREWSNSFCGGDGVRSHRYRFGILDRFFEISMGRKLKWCECIPMCWMIKTKKNTIGILMELEQISTNILFTILYIQLKKQKIEKEWKDLWKSWTDVWQWQMFWKRLKYILIFQWK